jgi:hypothetical protein
LQVVVAAITSPILTIVAKALKISLYLVLTYEDVVIYHEHQELFLRLLVHAAELSVRIQSGPIHKSAEKLLK